MILANEKLLGEALVSAKLITPAELQTAIDKVEKKLSPNLIIQLIENDFLKFSVFQKFLTQNYNIRTAILNIDELPRNLIDKIGLETMKEKMVIPVMAKSIDGVDKLALGMVNPLDEKTVAAIESKTGYDVTPILISISDFKETIGGLFRFEEKLEKTPISTYEDQLMNLSGNPRAEKRHPPELFLKGAKKSDQELKFDQLDVQLKFQALANSLILRGVLTKNDIISAGNSFSGDGKN